MIEDTLIAEAAAMQRHRPTLTAGDWRLFGAVIDAGPAGLAYAAIRADTAWFGTSRKHLASIDRLLAAGLISKQQAGGSTSPISYVRTAVPIIQQPVFQPTFVL